MNETTQEKRFKIPWAPILFFGALALLFGSMATLGGVSHPVEVLETEGGGIESVELYEGSGGFIGGLSVQVRVTGDVQAVNLISDRGNLADRQQVHAGVDSVVVGSQDLDVNEEWRVVAVGSDGEVVGTVTFKHNLEFWWDRPPIGSK